MTTFPTHPDCSPVAESSDSQFQILHYIDPKRPLSTCTLDKETSKFGTCSLPDPLSTDGTPSDSGDEVVSN
jgi:hypothetical protein